MYLELSDTLLCRRDISTFEKTLENGKPPSLAKAQANRDTDARLLKFPTMVTIKIMEINVFVALTDFVAE
jgi:hypothetical protein